VHNTDKYTVPDDAILESSHQGLSSGTDFFRKEDEITLKEAQSVIYG
jgi:hypothetical protein